VLVHDQTSSRHAELVSASISPDEPGPSPEWILKQVQDDELAPVHHFFVKFSDTRAMSVELTLDAACTR
jgi:hypothetical protein